MAKKRKINWKKRADDLWKIAVRKVGYCERCGVAGEPGKTKGSWLNLESHHIISRGHDEYRHLLINGICLCHKCHKYSPWAVHNDKTGFLEWLCKYKRDQFCWWFTHTVDDATAPEGGTNMAARKTIRGKREKSYQEICEELKAEIEK